MSLARVQFFSVSLDGFGTGEGLSRDEPFGHAGGLDVRIGGGVKTIRAFLAERLIDHMHVTVVPILLGRGVRFRDGLEGLDRDYAIEATTSPSGVTHVTFKRASR